MNFNIAGLILWCACYGFACRGLNCSLVYTSEKLHQIVIFEITALAPPVIHKPA
ncbi:hypothetical protein PVAP13_1NG131219 [Panicum virgatum]|uniref:Uncharacterized protein n=1 Tax=Panicum virgatum TaxID=38727 RepID=A0A8T0WR19_PANVG|nr:hypothetical protein PVAP13_1NG131219 [Panicum virgatum]